MCCTSKVADAKPDDDTPEFIEDSSVVKSSPNDNDPDGTDEPDDPDNTLDDPELIEDSNVDFGINFHCNDLDISTLSILVSCISQVFELERDILIYINIKFLY
jgi:hypothetical protein